MDTIVTFAFTLSRIGTFAMDREINVAVSTADDMNAMRCKAAAEICRTYGRPKADIETLSLIAGEEDDLIEIEAR